MKEENTKFLVFGHDEYIKQAYRDISTCSNFLYFDFKDSKPVEKKVQEKLVDNGTNPIIKRCIMNFVPKLSGFDFTNCKPGKYENVIVIMYERNLFAINTFFLEKMRKVNPNIKIVFRFTNIISSTEIFDNLHLIPVVRNGLFDLVITFSQSDAEKYNLSYFGFVNSCYPQENSILRYDLLFCGKDKGRSGNLREINRYLTEHGVKTKFIIVKDQTSPTEEVCEPGIEFIDVAIPFSELMQYVVCSTCILELLFDQSNDGDSLRVSEAVANGKRLLTNNPYVKNRKFYSDKQFFVFERLEEIDISFILRPLDAKEMADPRSVDPQNMMGYLRNLLFDK